jgi:hypothetical protein
MHPELIIAILLLPYSGGMVKLVRFQTPDIVVFDEFSHVT